MTDDDMIEAMARAINLGWFGVVGTQDPKRMTLVWADVPDEVFAQAAIDTMWTAPRLHMNGNRLRRHRKTERISYYG